MARKGKLVLRKLNCPIKRQVTFTKRRQGLFKKGSELCTLCGAEVVIIAFSPGGKVYTFGHPCHERIIERYLRQQPEEMSEADQFFFTQRKSRQLELNKRATELEELIAKEVTEMKECDKAMCQMFAQRQQWWEKFYDDFNLGECEVYEESLNGLKDYVRKLRERAESGGRGRTFTHGFNGANVPYEPVASRAGSGNHVPVNPLMNFTHRFSGANAPYETLGPRAGPGNHVSVNPLVNFTHGFRGANAPYEPVGPTVGPSCHVPINPLVNFTHGSSGANAPYEPTGARANPGDHGSVNPLVLGLSGQAIDTRALKGKAPMESPMSTAAGPSHVALCINEASGPNRFSYEHSMHDPMAAGRHGVVPITDTQAVPVSNQGAPVQVQAGFTSHTGYAEEELPDSMKALHDAICSGLVPEVEPDDPIGTGTSQGPLAAPFVNRSEYPGLNDMAPYNPVEGGAATVQGGPSIVDSRAVEPNGTMVDNMAGDQAAGANSLDASDDDYFSFISDYFRSS